MRKLTISILVIIVILIIARLALAPVLLKYVEYRINQIPEYKVHIGDLNINLYRGSYSLTDVSLQKISKNIPVPFFSAKTIDFSVEWKALLHGSLVAKIYTYQPEVNFVIDPKGNNEQLSIDKEWQQAVKALFPLNFNLITGEAGKLSFQSFNSKPPFNLYLKDINFSVNNMQNAQRRSEKLPSSIDISANTMDGAAVNFNGRFDPFTKQPTFYFTAEVKNMQMKEANNFLQHYVATDIKQGTFSLYVEAAAKNGKITGYAKPIVKDLKIIDPKDKMGPVEALYKGALEVVAKILKNSQKDTIATKINISGQIDDPDTSILSIIGYLLRHAFIQALLPQIDHTIEMQDVTYPQKKSTG